RCAPMWGWKGRLPGPAIVIAIVALVAAMSGAALAGPSAKKVTTKKVKQIADKEIDKKAPSLSVAHAGSADSATNAANAANATHAMNANRANNVKPVKPNFVGTNSDAPPIDQGGTRVSIGCTPPPATFVFIQSTAANGGVWANLTNAVGAGTT